MGLLNPSEGNSSSGRTTLKKRIVFSRLEVVRGTGNRSVKEHATEFKVVPVGKKLSQYRRKWLYHVSRMEDTRYPKQLLKHRPI